MSLFSKSASSTPHRRLGDEPLDGQYAKTLPLLQRVFIRVLVSELRQMLDERDAERELRAKIYGPVGVDPSAQRDEIDRGER